MDPFCLVGGPPLNNLKGTRGHGITVQRFKKGAHIY
jgi:hypothetical protein